MRTYIMAVASVGVLVLSAVALPVSAHSPTASITSVNGIPATSGFVSLRVPYLPYAVFVGGVVNHGKPANINSVWLSLSDNFLDFFGPEHYFKGAGNVHEGSFSVPWTIDVAGAHFLQAAATHGKGNGGGKNNNQSTSLLRSAAVGGLEIEIEVGQ